MGINEPIRRVLVAICAGGEPFPQTVDPVPHQARTRLYVELYLIFILDHTVDRIDLRAAFKDTRSRLPCL